MAREANGKRGRRDQKEMISAFRPAWGVSERLLKTGKEA